jgi:hypothetical protein
MPSVGYGDWEPRNDKRGRRNKTEQTNPAAVQGRREDKRRHRLAAAGGPGRASKRRPVGTKGIQLQRRMKAR